MLLACTKDNTLRLIMCPMPSYAVAPGFYTVTDLFEDARGFASEPQTDYCSKAHLDAGVLAGVIIGSLAGFGLLAGVALMLSHVACKCWRDTSHVVPLQGKGSNSRPSTIHTLTDTLVGEIVVNDNGIITTMVPGQTMFQRRPSTGADV